MADQNQNSQAGVVIQPPPRLTGDPNQDVVALSLWTTTFYQAAFVQGGIPTQQDIDNTVDPTKATAESAQTTANEALGKANASKAILDKEAAGTFTISGTDLTGDVTLSTAQVDTNYSVVATPESSTGAAAGAFIIVGVVKSTNKFTPTLQAAPGSGKSITYAWHLRR